MLPQLALTILKTLLWCLSPFLPPSLPSFFLFLGKLFGEPSPWYWLYTLSFLELLLCVDHCGGLGRQIKPQFLLRILQSRGRIRWNDCCTKQKECPSQGFICRCSSLSTLVWREPASYALSRAAMELLVQTLGEPANIKCSNQRSVDQKCNRLPTLYTKNS